MALFQNSVLRHHLKHQDTHVALQAYAIYQSEFLPKIANIRTSKEEQYQYGFLDDLFVNLLGYTLNPTLSTISSQSRKTSVMPKKQMVQCSERVRSSQS
jgi:hypothetical protein